MLGSLEGLRVSGRLPPIPPDDKGFDTLFDTDTEDLLFISSLLVDLEMIIGFDSLCWLCGKFSIGTNTFLFGPEVLLLTVAWASWKLLSRVISWLRLCSLLFLFPVPFGYPLISSSSIWSPILSLLRTIGKALLR